MRKSRLLFVAVLAIASIALIGWSSSLEAPFIIYFLVAGAWAATIALLSRPEALRNGALIGSSVFFSMALVETYMYFANRSEIIITRTVPIEWRRDETDIGSQPAPNTTATFEEALGGRLIDKVTYRFGGNGLREIPATVQGGPHKVVFFGCSFMFGHGVEDDQTLPYYFVRAAAGTFEGFNFAGDGWGPHQMLREIETGFMRRVAGTPELGGACHAAHEAGFNLPKHLMRPPAITGEIEALEGASCCSYKVIGQRLIVFDPMTKHKRTTEEHYSMRSSLNCCGDFSKTVVTESVRDLINKPAA